MTQPAKGQEPSMEEILASIRRIIADVPTKTHNNDSSGVDEVRGEGPRLVVGHSDPPTEPIPTAGSLPEPEFATSEHVVQPTSDEDEEEQSQTELEQELERAIASRPMRTQPEPQAQVPRYAQRLHEPEISDEALISANTTAAVNSAFNTLAQTVLVQNGRTLEDLVREMLRPMLKVWLDDNLPGMVERLVRAEIERVSRGRG
ncbi:MAG TPA: DUF2497 domain-containing protein [Steroidobacteraceae bacterium]|nr:DUF2497 domain-containing protein [Steroidobacteraceae bacterium]